VTTSLFAIIFKVLPDARIQWKDIWPGAIATSLLFVLGKFAISLYISKSDLGSSYGAAGSLAVIFVWIYYSSIILYFGAEFTKAYAFNRGAKIIPNKYAQWDHEPTVPGAEPKEEPATGKKGAKDTAPSFPSPSEKNRRPLKQPIPQLASNHPGIDWRGVERQNANYQKGAPGFGKTLAGLALYFMTRNKK
jgi:membrane protein